MTPRRHRIAFRPTIDDFRLEERVCLSTATTRTIPTLVGPAVAAARFRVQPAQEAGDTLTDRQLRTALRTQLRASYRDLRLAVNAALSDLARTTGGSPTPAQLADVYDRVLGSVNATAYRLLGLSTVVPGGERLTGDVQALTVAASNGSLATRLGRALARGVDTDNFATVRASVNRELVRAQQGADFHLERFLRTTNFSRLAVDPETGEPVALGAFVGRAIASQYGNALATLATGFPDFASSSLFAQGATPTAAQLAAFGSQTNAALGALGFQLGSSLSLVPGASSSLTSGFQNAFFGNDASSFTSGFANLPLTDPATFNQGAGSLFNNLFTGTIGPLNSFFGFNDAGTPSLPTAPVPTAGLDTFNSFGNGFNNGFGTGTIGFGPAPTTASTSFNNGFFGSVATGLSGAGFTVPTGTFGTF